MAATVKQLAEERAPIGVEIRTLADRIHNEARDFTAEERSNWDKMNADFNRLTAQIDAAKRSSIVTEELGRRMSSESGGRSSTPGLEDTVRRGGKKGQREAREVNKREEVRALAMQAWFRKQSGLSLTPEQVRACKAGGLDPRRRSLDVQLMRTSLAPGAMKRALSPTTGSAGAYTIPQGFVYNLEKALLAFNGMRQVAAIMRTDSGNLMPWPTVNDTANAGTLISANTQVSETDPPFGQVQFSAYKFTSGMVQIPTELLEDTAFNLGDEVGVMLGTRIGRGQEQYFTNGTGTDQPQGALVGASLGVTAMNDGSILPDEILSLIHSVDPAYRKDPSFGIMFHDQILAVIRKMKDSVGRYLFEEGQNGAPDKVKGVPITINQNMPYAMTSGQKTMLCGAFGKFKIRDVNQVRIMRLVERYADYDQVGFVAFVRSDSRVLDAGTGPIKYYVHP